MTRDAHGSLIAPIQTVDELEERLSRPSDALIEFMRKLDGDIIILGVGGKMGPTLARMAARAVEQSAAPRRITGVSSFSTPGLREQLESYNVATVQADLLAPGATDGLPDAENVIYMVGRKFGSTGAEWNTWATNTIVPVRVAERYCGSRIVMFSSGNVYPFEPVVSKGSTEETPPAPVGEYAMAALGRERMFDYFSHAMGARVLQYRLNYAAELRYGVVLDVAMNVWNNDPVDITTGHLNCVWQGYANDVALQCLGLAESPPHILNVTGPEVVSVREMALGLGAIMDRTPRFTGEEAETALLSDASRCVERFGAPDVSVDTLIEWVAQWVMNNGDVLDKPTHFQTRDGKF